MRVGYAVLVFLLLPTMLVVPMSFGTNPYLEFPPTGFSLRWYEAYFNDRGWMDATLFSARIAILTSVASTLIGTLASVALVRGRLRGRSLIELFILAPVIIPTIVIAIASFLYFARLQLIGHLLAFVLAHTVLAVPYVVLSVSASLIRVDADLDLAAMGLGASRTEAFFRVTLPLILPGVISGAVFGFIISFDEAVVSFFLSGVHDKTLPRLMFENIELRLTPTIAAVSTLLTALSIVALTTVLLLGRVRWRRPS
jgi:mannopine transport system permease protein